MINRLAAAFCAAIASLALIALLTVPAQAAGSGSASGGRRRRLWSAPLARRSGGERFERANVSTTVCAVSSGTLKDSIHPGRILRARRHLDNEYDMVPTKTCNDSVCKILTGLSHERRTFVLRGEPVPILFLIRRTSTPGGWCVCDKFFAALGYRLP